MKTLRKGILPAAVTALAVGLASPAAAQEGEEVVPPENSAVNQYTESFPTASGDKDAYDQKGDKRTPAKVLGTRNAKRLEQRGSEGHAVAELTAETAPVTAAPPTPVGENQAEEATLGGGQGGSDDHGQGNAGSDRRGPVSAQQGDPGTARAIATRDVAEVDGSSGVGAVIAQALGSPSGGMGLLLPLLLLGTIAWAIAYAMRQRRPAG